MKYFSTFSGIGGFELGIKNAIQDLLQTEKQQYETENSTSMGQRGLDNQLATRLGNIECVGYSEIDKYAIKVYERHFNEHINYGDITKIKADKLQDFDCLVGGFPCQAFSIAGKRAGFQDTRGTLFFDLARILQAKRPRLFVFENVKGLLSHDNGNTFRTIIATIDELGYDCQWQVLNSKDFGVPQNRERVIIVGHLRGTPRPEVFPFTRKSKLHLEEITSGVSDAQRIYTTRLAKNQKALGGGLGAKTGLYDVGDAKIRRLTPVESERLQGFPDDWTKYGIGDELISDTQRYKMCGNAVTTNVIQAVFERILV